MGASTTVKVATPSTISLEALSSIYAGRVAMRNIVRLGFVQTPASTRAEQLDRSRIVIHAQEHSLVDLGTRDAIEAISLQSLAVGLVDDFRGKVCRNH